MTERRLVAPIASFVLAALMLVLWLVPSASAASPNGTPDTAFLLRDRASGTIVGQSGGSFAYYLVSLRAGAGSARVEMTFASSDGSALRAAGAKVYGTTSGKEYASLVPTNNGATVVAEFEPGESGSYLIQAYFYAPVAVDYTIAVSGARLATSPRTIVIDPGHGGPEIGAASGGVIEKQVNLQIALKLAALLRTDGHRVVLTRDSDRAVSPTYTSSRVANGLKSDLQARVDVANAAQADVFICIHNNGGPAAQSGTEVWFNRARPFSAKSQLLAQLTQQSLVERIRALGYPVRDRGLKPDDHFSVINGQDYNLFVLGPDRPNQRHTPTQMPGILGESLFISNPDDLSMLRQERTLDAIAAGYRDAIDRYFATK